MDTIQFPLIRPAVTGEHELNPDFLALGLGGTNMMAMLWTVAMGRRAVGVEMRGDPFLGVHWNIRVDLYHQLGLIDEMMLERYGPTGVPCRADGRIFRLADCFYSTETAGGDIVADEVIDGYDDEQHIVGTIQHVEFIDDRWRDGLPHRAITVLPAPEAPEGPDPRKIRTDITAVLDGPSTFQAEASSVQLLLRRYLEGIQRQDLASGREPRVRLFTHHRVLEGDGTGFVPCPDGRMRIRIESLQEFDFKDKFVRIREPGSEVIDIGVPELFMIAQGFHSSDAQRLGFERKNVEVDHHDQRGPVVAQADFLAGLIEILVDGRLRRRISSEFDQSGNEYWVRQIAVGHENDPEVGWVLVQVPDFKTFDPIEAGLVPPGTDPDSPEFYAAYQHLTYEFYMAHAAQILGLPKAELKKVQMLYGPKMFSLVEQVGEDALLAANGVVAGDSFGNGHFLTSGGAMTGMIGHSARVLDYWRSRDSGESPANAIRSLADGIKEDTQAWLNVSAQEFSEAVPINFGTERIRQITQASGAEPDARASAIDASRRTRHSLLPLDASDWRRPFVRNGKVLSSPLPPLDPTHPALSRQRKTESTVVYVAASCSPGTVRALNALLAQRGTRVGLVSQAPLEALPADMRDRLAAHAYLGDATDPGQIIMAIGGMSLGSPDLVLGAPDLSQVPLEEVRDQLGLAGARQLSDRYRIRELLTAAGLPVAGEEHVSGDRALDVMSIGGVPVWYSPARLDVPARPGDHRTHEASIVPRENDPADAAVRRLAFAALQALGIDSGMSRLEWSQRPDGSAAICDVTTGPPAARTASVLGYAHDTDIYRSWAEVSVHARFTPIERRYASGAALLRVQGAEGRASALHRLHEVQHRFGPVVVEAQLPHTDHLGTDSEWFIVLRHPETAVVDQALKALLTTSGAESSRLWYPEAA